MIPPEQFVVGRRAEVRQFDDLLAGRTDYWLLNIYGPGGIGKSVVGRKLVAHAEARGAPVAAIDGIGPDLTPDRLLNNFAQQLTARPARTQLADAFTDFERRHREYLAISQILEQGGGVQALFDTVGGVKDPARLSAILEGLEQTPSEATKRTVSNRFALERYLRSAERALTEDFVAGLGTAVTSGGRPIALVLDTYEEIEGLDDWVCRAFVPSLPSGVRLVILGRNELHRINFDWAEQGDVVHTMPLPELGERDAKTYLRHYGLTDAVEGERVYQFTGGYPLLLVLVRYLAMEAGGWQSIGGLEHSGDRDRVASQLLERILREERVADLRAFLEKGVVARWFDPEIISVVLETGIDEGRAIYERLRRHSFVERHPHGLKFHDKIRELLLERLKFTSLGEYDRLTERLLAYYAAKAGIEHQSEAGGSTLDQPSDPAAGPRLRDSSRTPNLEASDPAALVAFRDRRCADLSRGIQETLTLIKSYEDERRLADDPKAMLRIERELNRLREQLTRLEREYGGLGCP